MITPYHDGARARASGRPQPRAWPDLCEEVDACGEAFARQALLLGLQHQLNVAPPAPAGLHICGAGTQVERCRCVGRRRLINRAAATAAAAHAHGAHACVRAWHAEALVAAHIWCRTWPPCTRTHGAQRAIQQSVCKRGRRTTDAGDGAPPALTCGGASRAPRRAARAPALRRARRTRWAPWAAPPRPPPPQQGRRRRLRGQSQSSWRCCWTQCCAAWGGSRPRVTSMRRAPVAALRRSRAAGQQVQRG